MFIVFTKPFYFHRLSFKNIDRKSFVGLNCSKSFLVCGLCVHANALHEMTGQGSLAGAPAFCASTDIDFGCSRSLLPARSAERQSISSGKRA